MSFESSKSESVEEVQDLENPESLTNTIADVSESEALYEGAFGKVEKEGRFQGNTHEQTLSRVIDAYSQLSDRLFDKEKEKLGDPAAYWEHNLKRGEDLEVYAEEAVSHLLKDIERHSLDIASDPTLESLWEDPMFIMIASEVSADYLVDSFVGDRELDFEDIPSGYQGVIYKAFESLGFDREQTGDLIKSYWSFGGAEINPRSVNLSRGASLLLNVRRAIDLESKFGGSASYLYEKYGIRHFARYSLERLTSQVEEEPDQPLSVSFAAVADWNGAFAQLEDTIADLEDTKDGYQRSVIVEGGTLLEAARKLVRVAKESGPIERLIVFGHGNKDGITVGEGIDGEGVEITSEQIEESDGVRRLVKSGIFSKKAVVILSSCSTGKRGGIAHKFSKKTKTTVFAPKEDSYGVKRDSTVKGKLLYKYKKGKDEDLEDLDPSRFGPRRQA